MNFSIVYLILVASRPSSPPTSVPVVQTRRETDNMESPQLGQTWFQLASTSSLQTLCGLSTWDFGMETKRI